MSGKVCSVSVDLDPIDCYYRIHALGQEPEELATVILERCLPRFLELFAAHGIEATFFVVGRELDLEHGAGAAMASRARLAECLRAGHELGNHSYSHPYDLARYSASEVSIEIGRAHDLLSELGAEVRGFRAPGYDLSVTMIEELDRLGYEYDSSIFPAPGYYAAKLAILGAMRLTGRPSGAVITNPLALMAPTEPYRPSLRAPWRKGHARLVELPITVTPGMRIPAIGTSLLLAPPQVRERLLSSVMRRSFFNFELHGIDLADAEDDGIPGALVEKQPDLRVSLEQKLSTLDSILATLSADYSFQSLARTAAGVQATS